MIRALKFLFRRKKILNTILTVISAIETVLLYLQDDRVKAVLDRVSRILRRITGTEGMQVADIDMSLDECVKCLDKLDKDL